MKTKIIFSFCILVFLIGVIPAASITIDMQPSFRIGEKISFDYAILSNTNEEIPYVVSVDCPTAPLPLLEIKNVNLTANIPLIETYVYMSEVTDDLISQTCTVSVGVIGLTKTSTSKSFEILTNPVFDFNLNLCKDSSCFEKSTVFIKGENIYLNYNSDMTGLTIVANLIYPHEKIESLFIPSSIKTEQIGTYTLLVTASKKGYKTISQEIQFGVIEKEVEINYVNLKEIKEQNQQKETFKKITPYLIGAGIVLVLAVLFLIMKKGRTKK